MNTHTISLTTLAFGAALLLITGAATAQDETPESPEPPLSEGEIAPEVEPETTAPPAPAQDPTEADPRIDIREFGDWELRCEVESGNCFIYQLARDEALNPVSEISIVALPEDSEAAAGATVITPLGTDLTEGVVMQIDQGSARQYPFNWCTRSGCYSRFGLTEGEVDAMRRGAQALIRIVSISAPEQPVVLNFSLTGFTAAFEAMTTAN